MPMKPLFGALAISALVLGGCSGLHKSGKITSVHAESLHLFGLQIPGSAQDKAVSMLPENAELVTGATAPEDLSSLYGFLNRVWGVGYSTFTVREK